MADVIKCLVCGENNLTDQEFCQYCQSRLVPLTGDLKGADAPIKPGQAPTKKNTAELEPILPQWLRDARDSARKSTEHELTPQEKHKQESFNASGFDLLAGLQNQKTTSDEEETPEWLAGLTGDSPKSKKDEPESSEVRWVELGGVNDFAPKETLETGSGARPESASEKDELNDWFRDASGIQPQQPEPAPVTENPFTTPPALSDETPDWLRKMVADSQAQRDNTRPLDAAEISAASDTPDWLRSLSTDDDPQATTADEESDAASAPLSDQPDWLRALGGSSKSAGATADLSRSSPGAFEAAEGSSSGKLPEWMDSPPPSESEKPRQGTVPNWLKEETPATSAEAEIPVWLSPDLPAQTEEPASEETPSFADIPNWLKAAAPQSSIYADEQPAVESFDTPDWLKTSSDAQPTPAFAADEPPGSAPPAFTPDAQASYNMDALFTDMPDWLSKATENPNLLSQLPAAGTDSIAPGDLPSWVQAMRPVGSGELSDETLETRGALAGLQGVLPAVAGFTATSKPKAYSIKLNASEEQQTHAAFLEQILAAETAPVPIASFTSLKGSRGLRWAITFILFAVLVPAQVMGTQFFSMPVGIPAEIREAMRVAQSIPEGAPVLVAIDYEPARVGEMEAAAAPIFKHLKNPNLTFIATNETGGLLAGRFISGPLAGLGAESGIQPLNLGYLPGGQMGIRAFGKNPPAAAPFDISLSPVWTSPQLQGITSLSQFAVLIIISDNANSTRAWIEQTTSTRGDIPVLVISSAQAAPMIQPYFDSRQVSGLVTGLYGGAVVDQTYGGTTARNYWDAYSLGMYLAMALMLGGGLINLALGLRDRAAAREAK
ncbi:MAG: hypothetical protein HY864_05430 [Chloroflexi bacterium]|nr:hypothetical protein [Chloroflexota bacterium]